MPDTAELAAALRAVMPSGIGLGLADPTALPSGLWPGENLVAAVPRRQAEFAAGRRAARAAMAALGWSAAALPMGPDRAPIWPGGLMGSISHTDRYCAALVGRAADWAGIGLDLEPAAGLDADLWPEILTDAERADLATLPTEAQPLAAKTVFCIKEAVYKAQYPVSRTLFGFHTLHVTVTAGGFSARFLQGVPGFALGRQVSGRLFCTRAVCGALCWLPAGQVEKMP